MSALPRIKAPRRSDVLSYKYVTPRDPPPPDDPFHKDHKHWQYIDKGIDLLDYNGTDQELLKRKFKQMAFKQFQPYDNKRRLIEYAFDAGYSYGIKDTSTFLAKSRAVLGLEHKINIDKYNQELAAAKKIILNYPEFEVYKQHPIETSRVINSSFDAGYDYAKIEAFMPTSIIRSSMGTSHVMNPDKHIAAKKALLPKNFKTYKQILFEILDNARYASLAAQADAEAQANTWRGTITSGLGSLGSRVKARLLSIPRDPEYTMVDLLGGRSRRHRAKRVVSKKTTRCRRKSGRGRRHCK